MAIVAGQRVVEPGEQVVVGHHRQSALARLDLLANPLRQSHPHLRNLALGGGDPRSRVGDRDPRDLAGLRAGQRRRVAGAKAPHVQVVDNVGDEVAQVLHELGVRLEVGGDPEPAEHLLAEAMRGRDRRRVEFGERAAQPPTAERDLVLRAPRRGA